MAKLARSAIESVVDTVFTGLESPVDAVEAMLDMGDKGSGSGSVGSAGSVGAAGEGGEDRLDEGGVSNPDPSAPSNSACRSPVDRLKANGRDRSGEDSLLVPFSR
jgi:hypothetical protein